jgi:hypothetical protein
MSQLNIRLPDDLTDKLRDDELEALLGARANDAGPVIEATPEFWDGLKRQFESRRKRGS